MKNNEAMFRLSHLLLIAVLLVGVLKLLSVREREVKAYQVKANYDSKVFRAQLDSIYRVNENLRQKTRSIIDNIKKENRTHKQ